MFARELASRPYAIVHIASHGVFGPTPEASFVMAYDGVIDIGRFEIETALARGKRVIPVLLPGARMPAPEQLPESIRDLAFRNAFEFSYKDWRTHVEALIRQLPGTWGGPGGAPAAGPTWKSWAAALGVSIPILMAPHVFAVFNLAFDPQFLLAGAALLLGLFAGRLNFSIPQSTVAGVLIALSTGLLTSAIIGLLFGQSILPADFLEARLLLVFIGILFVAYLSGSLLAPAFSRVLKPSRSPRRTAT